MGVARRAETFKTEKSWLGLFIDKRLQVSISNKNSYTTKKLKNKAVLVKFKRKLYALLCGPGLVSYVF